MIIRKKLYVSVIISSLVTALSVTILVVSLIYPLVERLERRELIKDINRLEQMVIQDLRHLNSITKDWGYWDDTYHFVLDRNEAYQQTNLIDFWLDQYQIDALAIYSYSGNWTESISNEAYGLTDADYQFVRQFALSDSQNGLIELGKQIYLCSIVKVKGSDAKKKPAGIVVLLKQADDQWIEDLSNRFGTTIHIVGKDIRRSEPEVNFISSDQVEIETGIGLIDQPGYELGLQITDTRNFYNILERELMLIGVGVLFVFSLSILLIIFMLERTLIAPIQKIRDRIVNLAGPEIIRRLSSRDEWNEENVLKSLEMLAEETHHTIKLQQRLLEEQRDSYKHQSFTDPMTGLLNRRGLNSAFKELLVSKHPYLFCALLDVDYFKSINDTYGHDIGDHVVENFADFLRQHLGQHTILARTGGDEFCCVGVVDQLDEIAKGVSSLRDALKVEMGERLNLPIQITCSVGSVTVNTQCFYKLGELMSAADMVLYQVKVNRDNWFNYTQPKDCSELPRTLESLNYAVTSGDFIRDDAVKL